MNCVAIENLNDSEIFRLALLAQNYNIDIRFIELMPIGYGKKFDFIANEIVKQKLSKSLGNLIFLPEISGNGPAKYFKIDGFKGNIGFISAISHSFCNECNRIRLTCDGNIKLCLNYSSKINVKNLLRENRLSDCDILKYLKNIIYNNKPLCHDFYSSNQNTNNELKNMIQIGG